VLVAVFAAHIGLIDLDDAYEFLKFAILQRRTDAMAHVPSRFVRSKAHIAVNLSGADTLPADEHEVCHPEPLAKVYIRVFEDRADKVRKAIGPALAAIWALPAIFHGLKRIGLAAIAARAAHATGPTVRDYVGVARFLIRERCLELSDAHLHDLSGLFPGHDLNPKVRLLPNVGKSIACHRTSVKSGIITAIE